MLLRIADDIRTRWAPHLATLDLPSGAVLQTVGEPIRNMYFPQDAVVGLFHEAAAGLSMAVALIGPGGLVGFAGVLSRSPARHESVVLKPGRLVRLDLDHLSGTMDQDATTRRLVLSYLRSKLAQIGEAAVCSRFHSVEQQICLRLAQLFGDPAEPGSSAELSVTQDMLARIVGARREGVNRVISDLESAGVVIAGRGRLRLLDRAALIQRSCDCRELLEGEGA